MGEKENKPFQLTFNGFLKVDFQGSRVTSDGGLILLRELDERLGLGKLIDEHLTRDKAQTRSFRSSIWCGNRSTAASQATRISTPCESPPIRPFACSARKRTGIAAGRLRRVCKASRQSCWPVKRNGGQPRVGRSSPSAGPVRACRARYGLDRKPRSRPTGRQRLQRPFRAAITRCWFNQHGDCLAAKLRPGNVSSAEDWDELLLPEIKRQQGEGKRVIRADAAFAKPAEALEDRGVDYVIRIPANKNLELEIEDILFRPPGRPSLKPLVRYKSFRYQAASWSKPRRVVAKVEHHQGELFPRVGFIVTNMRLPSRLLVRFYNKRGTAEQWIKEGKQATNWTRLSCHRFRANQVRLQLAVLAYNLGNLWRRLGLPRRIKSWSLTSLQQRLMKTGGRLVKHARYYWLLLAEGHLNRKLFGDMLHRIWALPLPSG